jgi:hypothetical protein
MKMVSQCVGVIDLAGTAYCEQTDAQDLCVDLTAATSAITGVHLLPNVIDLPRLWLAWPVRQQRA